MSTRISTSHGRLQVILDLRLLLIRFESVLIKIQKVVTGWKIRACFHGLADLGMSFMQRLSREFSLMLRTTLLFTHHAKSFKDSSWSGYYAFCEDWIVDGCWQPSIKWIAEAYLDESGVKSVPYRHGREQYTVHPHLAAITVWRDHELAAADGQ